MVHVFEGISGKLKSTVPDNRPVGVARNSTSCTNLTFPYLLQLAIQQWHLTNVKISGPFDGSQVLITTDVFPHPPKIVSVDPKSRLPLPVSPVSPNAQIVRSFWEQYGLPGVIAANDEIDFDISQFLSKSGNRAQRRRSRKLDWQAMRLQLMKKGRVKEAKRRSTKPNWQAIRLQLTKNNPVQMNPGGMLYFFLSIGRILEQFRQQQLQWTQQLFNDTLICPPITSLSSLLPVTTPGVTRD